VRDVPEVLGGGVKHLTLRAVNEALRELGVELVRGEGYFYFASRDPYHPILKAKETGVYVYRLNDLSLARWVEEAVARIEEGRR